MVVGELLRREWVDGDGNAWDRRMGAFGMGGWVEGDGVGVGCSGDVNG